MPATLHEIRIQLEDAKAQHQQHSAKARKILLGLEASTLEDRLALTSQIDGFKREIEALQAIEAELIANGRAGTEMPPRTESRFNASQGVGAVITLPVSSGAQTAPREAPRIEARLPTPNEHELVLPAPLPASGDVF